MSGLGRPRTRRIAAQRSVRLGGRELDLGSSILDDVVEAEHLEYVRLRDELAPLPPRAERSKLPEKAWQGQIVRVAKTLGYYTYHPLLSRFSERGWPDLSLLHEARRRALWIECKTDEGVLTEKQVQVILAMRACGLEVHVLRPHDGLQAVADLLGRAA